MDEWPEDLKERFRNLARKLEGIEQAPEGARDVTAMADVAADLHQLTEEAAMRGFKLPPPSHSDRLDSWVMRQRLAQLARQEGIDPTTL
jgi:hypothetical protein